MEVATEVTSLIRRIAFALGEARSGHRLSERQLARLAGVSRGPVHRLERTGQCRPDLAVRVALALAVVDLYGAPSTLDTMLAERLTPRPPTPLVVDVVDVRVMA